MGDTALACFGRIPWIDHQGVRRAQQQRAKMSTMTATTATATAATPTTGMAATMERMTKVTWMAMVAATMTTTTMTSTTMTTTATTTTMGRRRCDGDDDDGTTTMERRRCDGDGLASAVPPIQGSNQLMSTVWGGVNQKEGQFRGQKDRNGSR